MAEKDESETQIAFGRRLLPPRLFGAMPVKEEIATLSNAEEATLVVKNNRREIVAAAKEYKIDELVLANVLYQERRHADPLDYDQDRNPRKYSDKTTFGPGQISIEDFRGLVDAGKVNLTAQEKLQYKNNPREFSEHYLIYEDTAIKATAALISERLNHLQKHGLIPHLPNDGKPGSLSLGQFVYGAALYSAGGRSNPSELDSFDRKGPTNQHIDLKNNDISGLMKQPKGDKMVFAFHYLPDAYEAMYDKKAPDRLSGYFHDTRIIRNTRRAEVDGEHPQVAGGEQGAPSVAKAATAFGTQGQYGHELFKHLAAGVDGLKTGLDPQQQLNVTGALAARSIEAQLGVAPAVDANGNGRIFAFENGAAGRVAFVDPQVAKSQPLEDSAGQVRDQLNARNLAVSMDSAKPQQDLEVRSRGPSMG